MRLLKRASASLKPLVIPAVTNAARSVGALANTLREIWAVTLGPSVQMVDKEKPTKLKGVT